MTDNKNSKGNTELINIKDLIRGAEPADYDLEEILTEFGGGDGGGKIVPFPGVKQPVPEEEPEEEPENAAGDSPEPASEPSVPDAPPESIAQAPAEEYDGPDEDGEDEEDPETPDPDKIIDFPEEESVLSSLVKSLSQKADDYAEHMFEESERENSEEVQRLERLIPGTDEEEEPPEPRRPLWRREPRVEPPPPDLPPQELARRYNRGLKGMRVRSLLVLALFVPACYFILLPRVPLPVLPGMDDALTLLVSTVLMACGILLGSDMLFVGLVRLCRGRVGMDTLCAFAGLFTLLDGIFLTMAAPEVGVVRLPYTAPCLLGIFYLLHGSYHKRCGMRLACRTAAASAEPEIVTLEPEMWNGRDAYCKWTGDAQGFGSQMQMDDGVQGIFRVYCPLLLLGCLLFSLLVSLGMERPDRLFWALSATCTASAALGGAVLYGRTFHKVARRLSNSGAALAGWPACAASRRGGRVLICDKDLFPTGTVVLNGVKIFGDLPTERVIAYTATLMRASGSGLEKLFHDLLRAQGGLMRNASDVIAHEGGGVSATIRGDQVLVGSASFMKLMEVALPSGLHVKNAVFCAIEGELAGIFALNYSLPDAVFPAMTLLLQERIGPVLATRDFNLIPSMLQQRFRLAADRMDFPPVERRWELSDPDQPHGNKLVAVLCREGMTPLSEAVVGAKRLRWATRLGAVIMCIGSTVGLLLAYYLTSLDAATSLSPLNLLIYLLLWLAPIWFLSGWAHRF